MNIPPVFAVILIWEGPLIITRPRSSHIGALEGCVKLFLSWFLPVGVIVFVCVLVENIKMIMFFSGSYLGLTFFCLNENKDLSI